MESITNDDYDIDLTDENKDEIKEKFSNLLKPVDEVLNSCNVNTGC